MDWLRRLLLSNYNLESVEQQLVFNTRNLSMTTCQHVATRDDQNHFLHDHWQSMKRKDEVLQ